MFVDDMGVMFNLLETFSKYSGNRDSSDLHEFSFLADWHQLTPPLKMKKYEKFAGHEMNLFLYFKDRIFFNNVVKEFLPSKREKQFIDRFVLEDVAYFMELLKSGELMQMDIDKQVLGFHCLLTCLKDKNQ